MRRAQLATLAGVLRGVGYSLFAIAVVTFIIGFATDFDAVDPVVVVWSVGLASIVLPPAIVLGYAVRKAEREDPNPLD